MVEGYRKAIGNSVWHFCSNCSTWPTDNYIGSFSPEQIGDEEFCNECRARHDFGDCGNDSDQMLQPKKCPVIDDGKRCGLDLRPESRPGIHVCSRGHRVLIVPPRPKN
jgi:hypothetical protein